MNELGIEFRLKASRSLPSFSSNCNVLRSHLLSDCKELERRGIVELPTYLTRDVVSCKFCSTVWREQKYKVSVKPKKYVSASIKKILLRHERDPDCLRKYEQSIVKRFQQNTNKLVLTCEVCNKQSVLPLPCPEIPVHKQLLQPLPDAEPNRKKKKKRKKDPLCGLKISSANSKQNQNYLPNVEVSKTAFLNQEAARASVSLGSYKSIPTSNIGSLASKQSSTGSPKTLQSQVLMKKKKPLNKHVLNKMLLKTNTKTSLRDFLCSLP